MMRKIQVLAAIMFAFSMSGYANPESLPDERRASSNAKQVQLLHVYDEQGALLASFSGQPYALVLSYVNSLPPGTYTISDGTSNSATAERRIIVYQTTS